MRRYVRLVALAVAVSWVGACKGILGIDDPDEDGASAGSMPSSSAVGSSSESPPAPASDAALDSLPPSSSGDVAVVAPADASQRDENENANAEGGAADATASEAGGADARGVDAGALTLYGATVNLSVHCCTAPPGSTNVAGTYPSAVVGPLVEFPSIGTSNVLPASVDVGPSSIEIDIPTASTSTSGGFNGYVLVFSPTPPSTPEIPAILAATTDKSSTAPLANVSPTFSNSADGTRTVDINVAGTSAPANSTLIIDLTLGPPDAG